MLYCDRCSTIFRFFCQLEINLTRQEIQKAKDSIIGLSEFAPGGKDSLQWPIGIWIQTDHADVFQRKLKIILSVVLLVK